MGRAALALPLCHTMPPCLCEAFGHLRPFLCVPGGQEHTTDKRASVSHLVPVDQVSDSQWGQGSWCLQDGVEMPQKKCFP